VSGILAVAWHARDPDRLRDQLVAAGFALGSAGRLAIAGLDVVIRSSGGPDRLELLEPMPPNAGRDISAGDARLLALGLAVVDLARVAPLAVVAPGALAARQPILDDLLGALATPTADARLLALEPVSEGRLAASLVRLGEGPAAIYLGCARPAFELAVASLAARGVAGRAGSGPFGAQHLAWTRPPWGPHLLLVPSVAGARPPRPGASATIMR
jgi:hypothetical protein